MNISDEKSRHRSAIINELRTLLAEHPGTKTPWTDIEICLARRIPVHILAALLYRSQSACTQTYDAGVAAGKGES